MNAEERLDNLAGSPHQILRWLGMAATIVAALAARQFTAVNLMPLVVLASLAAASGLVGAQIAHAILERKENLSRSEIAQRSNVLFAARTCLDLVVILSAIHFTGGIESVFLFFLPTYILLLQLQAGRRIGIVAGAGTILSLAIIVYLEYVGILPHSQVGLLPESNLNQNGFFTIAALVAIAAVLYFGAFYSHSITYRLVRHRTELAQSQVALTQRVQELSAQREIGQQLAGSLRLDLVLDTIASSTLKLVQATDVHLFLYGEATGHFGKGVGVRADGQRRLATAQPRSQGLSSTVVRLKQPVLIDDVEHHPLFATPEAKRWEIKSIAGFPIKKAGLVLGVLNSAFNVPHQFEEEERQALVALADQAALAIENASLYTRVGQRVRELDSLYQMSLKVSQSLDPNVLLDEALATFQAVMQIAAGMILLVDDVSSEPVLAAQRGQVPMAFNEVILRGDVVRRLAGQVLKSGSPVVFPSQDSAASPDALAPGAPITSSLAAVPLKTKERILGSLQVVRLDGTVFSDADTSLLTAIGQQIAIALENARLYGQSQRRADELGSLREIGLARTSTLDLREQLRALYVQVKRLLPLDTFLIGLYDEARQEINMQFVVEEGWELRGPVVPFDAAGLSAWVIRTQRPFRVDDLDPERDRLPAPPRHETRPEKSWLGVPLLVRDRVIGIVSAQSFRPHAFSAADERFLVSVAQQAVLAFESSRLYSTAERRARELDLLNEISHTITSSRDIEDRRNNILDEQETSILATLCDQIGIALANARLYGSAIRRERLARSLRRVGLELARSLEPEAIIDTLCEASLDLMNADSACVWMVEGEEFVVMSARGECHEALVGLRAPPACPGPFAQLLQERKAVLVDSHVEQVFPSAWVKVISPRSMIAAPIFLKDTVACALVVAFRRESGRFETEDVEQVGQLRSQASAALANAWQYKEVAQRAQLLS